MNKTQTQDFVTSKELALAGGVSLSLIHYYTTLGFLRVRDRAGNKRLYDSSEARASLKRIAELRKQGYSLSLIRRVFEGKGVVV